MTKSKLNIWRIWDNALVFENDELADKIIFKSYGVDNEGEDSVKTKRRKCHLIQAYETYENYISIAFPEGPPSLQGHWDYMLAKLAFQMKKGDIIITLDWKTNRISNLGMLGEYFYDQEHYREVKWSDNINFEPNIDFIAEVRYDVSQAIRNISGVGNQITSILNDELESYELGDIELANQGYVELKQAICEFEKLVETDKFKSEMKHQESDANAIRALMEQLSKLDQDSDEFENLVLFGLLPYGKTSYAARISRFPVFLNIKSFFQRYEYMPKDWKNLAKLIYKLATNVNHDPSKLMEYIEEFTSSPLSKGLQCGSLTPFLYALAEEFPIVNNYTISTYESMIKKILPGKTRRLDQKIKSYPKNRKLILEMIEMINSSAFENIWHFDYFTYWYNRIYNQKSDINTSDAPEVSPEELEPQHINIDFNEFLDLAESKKKFNESFRIAQPENIKLYQLILHVEGHRWLLPNFQRDFDWSTEDIKELWESIFKNYYIGSLLIWKTSGDPHFGTVPIKGVTQEAKGDNEGLILDGQQRITSIYYGIRPTVMEISKKKIRFYLYVNFQSYFSNKESIIEIHGYQFTREECFEKLIFPISEIENFNDWTREFRTYLVEKLKQDKTMSFELRDHYRDIIGSLIDDIRNKCNMVWNNYEIPFISLPSNIEISQVTDIFENLNSKGKPLTIFDLLIARLYRYEQTDLKGLWRKSREEYNNLGAFNKGRARNKIPIYLLQTISLRFNPNNSSSKRDILNIYDIIYDNTDSRDFREDWDTASKFTSKAIERLENLQDGYGVLESQVPYISMIPVLSALLWYIDGKSEILNSAYKKINAWYWSAVFSGAYSSAADSQMSLDYKETTAWISDSTNPVPQVVNQCRTSLYSQVFSELNTASNAKYLAILSIIALNGCKDWNTGLTPQNTEKHDKDHIFPKAYQDQLSHGAKKYINSILNMSWQSKNTNQKIKGAKDPASLIDGLIKVQYDNNENEFKKILKTHYIDEKCYESLKNNDFLGFIDQRDQLIKQAIADRIGLDFSEPIYSVIQPQTPFSNGLVYKSNINRITGHLHIIDKYFNSIGLEVLNSSVNFELVKEIKILGSVNLVDEGFRNYFKKFKKELENSGVNSEIRIIMDKQDFRNIHDRFYIGNNISFNAVSPDTMKRGQLSELTTSNNTDILEQQFIGFWMNAPDLIGDWNKLLKFKESLHSE